MLQIIQTVTVLMMAAPLQHESPPFPDRFCAPVMAEMQRADQVLAHEGGIVLRYRDEDHFGVVIMSGEANNHAYTHVGCTHTATSRGKGVLVGNIVDHLVGRSGKLDGYRHVQELDYDGDILITVMDASGKREFGGYQSFADWSRDANRPLFSEWTDLLWQVTDNLAKPMAVRRP